MSTIEICDLMLSTADAASGEIRANIGNTVDGTGFGASIPLWGVDGFLSRPNPAAGGKAAQGLYLTQGNSRRVFASRDTRWAGPFGAMGEGDRALVSNCDAGLWLDRASNSIRLQAGHGIKVLVDGTSGEVTISKDGVVITLTAAALTLVYNPASLPTPPAAIALTSTGVAITGTAVTVNGVPIP